MKVYLAERQWREHFRTIGIFSDEEKALEAIEKAKVGVTTETVEPYNYYIREMNVDESIPVTYCGW